MLHAMIMAGGGGTRFWPRSRDKRPKQFLSFSGDRTLLQETVDRIAAQVPAERTWVITGEAYVQATAEQLPELPPGHIIGEPCRRDTAPCVGLGAALIAKEDRDATMIVMPADHVIEPQQEFRRAVHVAEQFAADFPTSLLTFGIPPTFPSTGYGYIRFGAIAGRRQEIPASKVTEFREKPDEETAERYVAGGEYLWNSGIFVWKPAAILGELNARRPDIHDAVLRIAATHGTPAWQETFQKEYAGIKGTSIDYAVMQDAAAAGKVLVMQAPYTWDDVGSWLALERRNAQDADRNTIQGLHCGVDTSECVIVSDGDHLIGTLGVKELIIIRDGDATLVTTRKHESEVKKLVDAIKAKGLGRFL
ncbi:MAG TPA: mannose-1-phosphate guanylyltransferase [Urbifossiella sp.]